MKNIVIIGAGDFGKELVWLIEDINKNKPTYVILGFLDDDLGKVGKSFFGYEVLGTTEMLREIAEKVTTGAVVAMQDGSIRKKIVEKHPEFTGWETLVHPSAHISDTTILGEGCVICAGTNISVNSAVGNHCILNLSTTMGHDCIVENYVSIMSGAVVSGHVVLGECSYLGSNSTIVPFKKVGKSAKVGAGSVVIRNVKDHMSVMGVPATVLKF